MGATPLPVPTATPARPRGTPAPPATRRPVELRVPVGAAQAGNMVSLNGKNYLILEIREGAVTASPGAGGIQAVTAIEILPTDTQAGLQAVLASLGIGQEPVQMAPPRDGGSSVGDTSGTPAPRRSLLDLQGEAFRTPVAGQTAAGTSVEELTTKCLAGDLEACATLTVIHQALPERFDQTTGGGLTFEQQAQLQSQQLGQEARTEAQRTTEGISAGLAQALAAMGLAAPEIFLANAQDPRGLRDALAEALGGGRGVFPTIERQQLTAQATQSPTDIIRLLYMSGGQTPPPQRTGAFNVQSVLEQGGRAREDLARQIAGLDLPSFDELVNRFLAPLPPSPAYKGAIVDMRRNKAGVYEAKRGASVTHGPEIFTVGEKGTEFALLAPGSVVAPKLPGEEESRPAALRAVAEMLMFGERMPSKKRRGAKGKAGKPETAQLGSVVSEAEQPMQVLGNVFEALGGAGAALQSPGRGTAERVRDTRLQIFPFPSTTPEQRGTILAASRDNPFLRDILNIGLTERARNPVPFAQQSLTERQNMARSEVQQAMVRFFNSMGLKFEDLDPQKQEDLINRQLLTHAPELFDTAQGALSEIEGQTLRGIDESIREGGGAPGTQLPFAKLAALPAGARAATLTALGALFGSDVIADLQELFRQSRAQGFAAGESRLVLG